MLEWYKPLMAKRLSGVTTRVSGRPKYANQVAWIVQNIGRWAFCRTNAAPRAFARDHL